MSAARARLKKDWLRTTGSPGADLPPDDVEYNLIGVNMPLIKKMKHATRTEVSITTTYGAAKLSVFEHQSGCSNPDMLMLVSHGFQITPARTISGSNQALACFAFLVPIGVSLKRTRYDNWANLLASQFADAP